MIRPRISVWIERLQRRMAQPLGHLSCLAFVANVWPLLGLLWAMQGLAWRLPEVRAQYHMPLLGSVQRVLGWSLVWLALMAARSWRLRAREHISPLQMQLVLLPSVWVLCGLALLYGLVDTPMPMILLAIFVLTRALFPLRQLAWAWGSAGMALTLALVLQGLGRLPQSPLILAPLGASEHLVLWWALWARVMFLVALLPLSGALFLLALLLHRRRLEIEALVRSDPLTGLANRRECMATMQRESLRHLRSGRPLSLLLLDLDHFKAVNDQWGHAVGDAVLIEVGEILRLGVRPDIDLVARIGGEEFVVLLPQTHAQDAYEVATRLSAHLQRSPLSVLGVQVPMTVSIGVAAVEGANAHAALRLADRRLYEAKQAGRARIVGEPQGGENSRRRAAVDEDARVHPKWP